MVGPSITCYIQYNGISLLISVNAQYITQKGIYCTIKVEQIKTGKSLIEIGKLLKKTIHNYLLLTQVYI